MLVADHDTDAASKARRKRPSIPDRIKQALLARTVTLTIPRGEEGYWTLLRWLDSRGGFTIADGARRLPDDERIDFEAYTAALLRAGIVEQRGAMLRIARQQTEAPRLTKAGKERITATRQSYLWRGIKMLGFFTIDDLIAAVNSHDLSVTRSFATQYVDELAAAGYLLSRTDNRGTLYRMRPQMNTGPAAPQVLRARFVWDANLCRVMGQTTRIEEMR